MSADADARHGGEPLTQDPTLASVRAFCVDQDVIDFTVHFLADVGRRGFEGMVLWGGRRMADSSVEVVHAVAPEQRAVRGDEGVMVTVDGDALFRVNADFYHRGLLLCAQVHTHPAEAYHSDTDDAFAVVTVPGGLSLVVPWYARQGIDPDTTAVYRLSRSGEWVHVPPEDVIELIFVNMPDGDGAGGSPDNAMPLP